jgi:hypothetical protein
MLLLDTILDTILDILQVDSWELGAWTCSKASEDSRLACWISA